MYSVWTKILDPHVQAGAMPSDVICCLTSSKQTCLGSYLTIFFTSPAKILKCTVYFLKLRQLLRYSVPSDIIFITSVSSYFDRHYKYMLMMLSPLASFFPGSSESIKSDTNFLKNHKKTKTWTQMFFVCFFLEFLFIGHHFISSTSIWIWWNALLSPPLP